MLNLTKKNINNTDVRTNIDEKITLMKMANIVGGRGDRPVLGGHL